MPELKPATKTLQPDEPLPKHLRGLNAGARVWTGLKNNLNFYRIHLLFFTLTPLICSGIMYASNGKYHIPYIDCLFNSVSAMAVCGLNTTDLSMMTPWQQTILFIQMLMGSPVVVSLVMIAVRRHAFRVKFKHIIETQRRKKSFSEKQGRRLSFLTRVPSRLSGRGPTATQEPTADAPSSYDDLKLQTPNHAEFNHPPSHPASSSKFSFGDFYHRFSPSISPEQTIQRKHAKQAEKTAKMERDRARREEEEAEKMRKLRRAGGGGGLQTHMIRRVEGEEPVLVNSAGHRGGMAVEREGKWSRDSSDEQGRDSTDSRLKNSEEGLASPEETATSSEEPRSPKLSRPRQMSEPREQTQQPNHDNFPRSKTIAFDPDQVTASHNANHHFPSSSISAGNDHQLHGEPKMFPRTGTIEFVEGDSGRLGRRVGGGTMFERSATRRSEGAGTIYAPTPSLFPRTATNRTTGARSAKTSGFGGFPMPHEILSNFIAWLFPNATRKLTKTLTMQRTGTFASMRTLGGDTLGASTPGGVVKSVPYITFDAVVGRNSQFKDLTSEQLEELGGVEYRALKVLLWIIPCYYIGIQLVGWIIFWPYVHAKYADVFTTVNATYRIVNIGWFSAFQSVSAFSNTGMSLVDLSMLPFQTAYIMIVYLIFLVLAGNTAYPIFLRLTIWNVSKLVPRTSRLHETCRFLLDHPRRCYIYLFPSHQTLLLLMIILAMSMTDWVSFLVLDIGTPVIESIPVGTRIASAFLQSAAVRAAGFAIVPLASLAPAVKVLYTIMMYISVYPIAMSVRATNVYEERSLGLFEEEDDGSDDGEQFVKVGGESRMVGLTRYVAFHARRQLAFDIWWLALALWLVCILERGQLNATDNESYFNIFSVLFELVSAYGTVGLSLGVPYDNFSLSGAFRVLSKLVVCAVMIRGRHRGLPVAIDRAVMLPNEFAEEDAEVAEEERSRRSRRDSMASNRGFPMASDNSYNRRASTFSAQIPRVRPPQPFFPEPNPSSESALDDEEDDDGGPLSGPAFTTIDWARPPTAVGRLGGIDPTGGLTPVKEMISRRPSVDAP